MIELNRKEKIMSDILKPCPFCGSEADFWMRQAYEAEDYQALIIDCKDCPANMEEWVYKYDGNFVENVEKKKIEMFEAWNSRAERTAKVKVHSHPCGVSGKCCACGGDVYNDDPYCSHCGARMEWK